MVKQNVEFSNVTVGGTYSNPYDLGSYSLGVVNDRIMEEGIICVCTYSLISRSN